MNKDPQKVNVPGDRHEWVDYDRGISILLVSFRHTCESLYNSGINVNEYSWISYLNVFLFGFRMPLFFIASGIFLSQSLQKKGLEGYNISRIKTILYPMIIWGIIQMTLQILLNGQTNVVYNTSDYLLLIIDPRATGQFWYLNALFFVGGLYAVLKIKLKFNGTQQFMLGVLMYSLVAILRSREIYLGFVMDILQYYIFFSLGDNLSVFLKDKTKFNFYGSPIMLALLIPLFIIIQYNFAAINLKQESNYYVEHHMPIFFLSVAIVGCALSMNVSFMLSKMKQLNLLKVIGFHSIHIYCMQIIAMAGTRIILLKYFMMKDFAILTIIILSAGIFFPIVIYKLCLRMNAWWLFSLQKPSNTRPMMN